MSQPNNIAADDPRLTAYALGAMEPDEASAFEALLENDADARAEVEAIRALAGDLEGEFADLPRDEGLDDARREAVLAGGADAVAAASTPKRGSRLLFWSAAGLAASVLIAVPVAVMALKPTIQERARVDNQDGAALVGPTLEGASPLDAFDSRQYKDGHFTDYDGAASEASKSWGEIFPEEGLATDNDLPYDETMARHAAGLQNRSESPALREPADPSPATPTGHPTAGQRPSFGTKAKKTPQVGYIAPKADGASPAPGAAPVPVTGVTFRYETETSTIGRIAQGEVGSIKRLDQVWRGFTRGGQWVGWNAQIHGEQYTHPGIAEFYGRRDVRGGEFRRVDVDPTMRGGLLGHASILTLTSYPHRTSPVLRGKWVMEEILGTPPPPPPPGVGTLEAQSRELLTRSVRERLAIHREDPACAVCHDAMDNLGYGLENYDAVGAWRLVDGPTKVDSSGVLPGGRQFSGPAELKDILRADAGVPRCFAEKLLTYALGRGLEPYDRPAVQQIVREANERRLRFSAFVHAIVATDAFTMRRTAGGAR